MPTLVSPASSWGAFGFMAEGKLHGPIPELLALGERQFVHAWTILLDDQSAPCLFLGDAGFSGFHAFCIPQRFREVKPESLAFCH